SVVLAFASIHGSEPARTMLAEQVFEPLIRTIRRAPETTR
ncbi:MAG: hypothetical protein ACI90M_004626, partial [Candidatus Azotimanducaceae bacterium]